MLIVTAMVGLLVESGIYCECRPIQCCRDEMKLISLDAGSRSAEEMLCSPGRAFSVGRGEINLRLCESVETCNACCG